MPLLPQAPLSWHGPSSAATTEWQPIFESADATQTGTYTKGDRSVEVFHGAYLAQTYDKKLAGYHNTIFGSQIDVQDTAEGAPNAQRYRRATGVDEAGRHWRFLYSFYVGNDWVPAALKAQMRYGLVSFFGSPVSGVIALRTECSMDCAAADVALDEISTTMLPARRL